MTTKRIAHLIASTALASSAVYAQTTVVKNLPFVANTTDSKQLLDVYAPANVRNAPVIISFYGGALRAGDKAEQSFVGQRFAKEGFVTVVPNYRLSPAVSHPAHVEDAAAAVAWVRHNIAKYGGDSLSIVVIGHSAGAYLASLLTVDPRYLAAQGMTASELRGVAPVSAFFYVERTGVAPDRPKDVWGTDSAKWKAASPATFIHTGLPPMLLVYADGDDAWRRQQQVDFATAVKRAGNARISTQMIAGRTHNTVWDRMKDPGDEATSRAILTFIAGLPKHSER